MSDGPESSLKKIPASAHGPLTLRTGGGGSISLYKAYTCAAGITPFITAVLNVNRSSKDHARILEFSSGSRGGGGGGVGLRSIWNINYPFPRFQRRSNIFRGGRPTSSIGGGVVSNSLFPIETHITCDFPVSPSGSAHEDTMIRGLK